jgi:DNA-binding LytR/AlgR family response regulator
MIYQEPQIRVVVADDHPVTRDGVVRALKSSGKIEVVASVADGRAALEAIRELRPAVALLDYKMPELDGLQVILFIPYGGRTFAAPEGITHYISAHWYLPPDEFVQAVTACPEMRSAEYGQALAANGGRQLAKDFDPQWDDEFRNSLPPPESCAVGGCILLR